MPLLNRIKVLFPQAKILVVGLDNAGKTTMLTHLKPSKVILTHLFAVHLMVIFKCCQHMSPRSWMLGRALTWRKWCQRSASQSKSLASRGLSLKLLICPERFVTAWRLNIWSNALEMLPAFIYLLVPCENAEQVPAAVGAILQRSAGYHMGRAHICSVSL